MKLTELPEGCISHILSFTSPKDVIRSSIVCKQFLSASKSDAIWVKFLPSDYQLNLIISQSSNPLLQQQFDSKKDLFLHLSHSPLLFDNLTHSFALDKRSGKKCYMLGARVLSIAWGDSDTPRYWAWRSIPESRFPESAVLLDVCWLDKKGKMHTKFLSRSTTYGVYFVFKMDDNVHYGFEYVPIKAYVNETDEEGLSEDNTNTHQNDIFRTFYLETTNDDRDLRNPVELPVERGDGWMEIEMGRYQVADGFGGDERIVLEMTVKEVEMLNWKNGLMVQGIELRPID